MILKSFILGNPVSLCMKIINSVVVVGLYYGFLTTFSVGPSYLFLLRARVIEEGEERSEKKVSATTGFITGQLMMFISIYYAPLHLALGRPHTITVLALPYLLFHFFWNNHKHFLDYGSTTRNSMRNLSIQCVFLNNLIFQLFNHFILPSSMLVRLVNIYMFRCNNKILFVTSGFVGWLIGHILFMKWVGLILVWIQQNNSIRSNVLIRSNKYLVSELRNSMARIFSILLFITCVYSLGRIPSPIFTKKLKETSEMEEREEREEERDVEIETTSETKGTKQEQEGSTEEDPSSSLFSEEKEDPDKIDETEEIRVNGKEKKKDEFHFHFKETCYKNRPVYETFYLNGNQENSKLEILIDKKDKDLFWFEFEKPLGTILFDYKRWNRPFRYIKNDHVENAVRKEISQYFFSTCTSDGKERISFTSLPSLSSFLAMIRRKIYLFTTEKLYSDKLSNHWNYNNEEKKKNIRNEFINRGKTLDKEFLDLNTLQKKTRVYNDETKKEYLSKIYDPLLRGSHRGRIKLLFSPPIIKESAIQSYIIKNDIGMVWINKIHLILLISNYQELQPKRNIFHINSNRKSFSTEINNFWHLIKKFAGNSVSHFNFKRGSVFPDHKEEKIDLKLDSRDRLRIFNFFFDVILADPKNKTIRKNSTGIKEISKQVPRCSYKLIDDLEQQEGENEENVSENNEIRSRKYKRVVIFTDNQQNTDTYNTKDTTNPDEADEVALIRYSQQSDFRRDIIKGSMRAQRRKTAILELFQANIHSPFFLDRIDKSLFVSFNISELMKIMFINWVCKNKELTISNYNYTEEKTKKSEKKEEDKGKEDNREEKARIEIAEAWDSILFAQVIRGCVLVTQSILRKYIVLPSLIIVKNSIRMLLFQFPEWSEDLKDWNREMHVKCTYNGVQLSETEFPKNWLTDGIQIKILFPFRLKPWHRSKRKSPPKEPMKKKAQKNDFCFLTVWGMETELPFGSPQKRLSLFEPIFKKFEEKLRKLKKNFFLVLKNLEERKKLFLNLSKKKKTWVIKNILLLKEIINKLSKRNTILLFEFREVYELPEDKKEKDSIINNWMINKFSTQIRSMDWTNYSLTEKKMKDLTARTSTTRNQIEKIIKDKKKRFLTSERNISRNKISYNGKGLQLKSSKNISQILKRRNTRLVRKSKFFIKIWIERIYIDIFLGIMNIPRMRAQLFLESRRKILNKKIYNNENEGNDKKIEKTNQNSIHFISFFKKSLNNTNNSLINKRSQIFCDISFFSQAYVFYKLSQIQILTLYKVRSALQYHGTSLFLKNEIKDFFGVQGLFHSELKDKNLRNSVMNQWKNWLRSPYQYQYDLCQIRWSKLIPKKYRNQINQRRIIQNKNLNKWNFDEKDQLIHYEKQNDFEANSLSNYKDNFKKYYKYNLLAYKSINYDNRKDLYSYGSPLQRSPLQRSPVQVNKKKQLSYNYPTGKRKIFNIPIKNYIPEDSFLNMKKRPNRKYFDWRIFHFCLRKKVYIESWIDTEIDYKKNAKIGTNKYQIIDKVDKKDLFFLTIQQNKEVNSSNQKTGFFDWMGMNEEILNRPICNFELWFFPKLLILFNAYKIKPWVIPSKSLLLNFNQNEKVHENQKIKEKKNSNLFLASNEKKSIEFENQNQEEKDSEDQVHFGSVVANQEKDVEEDYVGSEMKKRRNKKQYKSTAEAELDFFLKGYLRFQLRWDDSLNQKIINNIKVYCLLLRLTNPREIILSSIQRGEMSLDILMIQKDLTLTELLKKGILIIEPVPLSVKNDGQFILYKTVSILLVHKSKQEINQRSREKSYVDKKNFIEPIESHQKSQTDNGNENDYDLLVPENILSPKHRRALRILISFNSKNRNNIHINTEIFNGNKIKNCDHTLDKNKSNHFDRDKNKLIKLKFFLWPNYRLEDLACMNRYWFDTNNVSRFSMVRLHIYPLLKLR
nr:Ycf1 protein [Mesua ferrea]